MNPQYVRAKKSLGDMQRYAGRQIRARNVWAVLETSGILVTERVATPSTAVADLRYILRPRGDGYGMCCQAHRWTRDALAAYLGGLMEKMKGEAEPGRGRTIERQRPAGAEVGLR